MTIDLCWYQDQYFPIKNVQVVFQHDKRHKDTLLLGRNSMNIITTMKISLKHKRISQKKTMIYVSSSRENC